MEKKEKKYVYFNENKYDYSAITEEHIKSTEDFKKYFGNYIDDDLFDNNNEIVIYELVPVKVFKKEITYKFV